MQCKRCSSSMKSFRASRPAEDHNGLARKADRGLTRMKSSVWAGEMELKMSVWLIFVHVMFASRSEGTLSSYLNPRVPSRTLGESHHQGFGFNLTFITFSHTSNAMSKDHSFWSLTQPRWDHSFRCERGDREETINFRTISLDRDYGDQWNLPFVCVCQTAVI